MFKLRNFLLIAAFAAVAFFVGCSSDDDDNPAATSVVSQIYLADSNGIGVEIGKITAMDSSYGLLLEVEVENAALTAGYHGFHLHTYPSCAPAADSSGTITPAGASGGHYIGDGGPNHEGPYGEGHKGDLPQLYAITGGKISNTVVAPRLTLSDIIGRAFIIHANPDDYAGSPGGARVACGTIGVTETVETTIYLVNTTGIGAEIGKITATDSPDGLLLVADLTPVPVGDHNFHVHEYPDCGVSDDGTPAGKAGGHYSVDGIDRGILPKLEASTGNFVKNSVLAPTLDPMLMLNEIKGHSLVIHATDGSRLACGVIGQ